MFDQWHVDPTRASSPSGSETRMGGGGHRPSPRWAALRAVWPRSHEHPRAMAMVMVGSIFTVSWSMVHGLNTWSRWCVMAMNMEKQCHQCDIWWEDSKNTCLCVVAIHGGDRMKRFSMIQHFIPAQKIQGLVYC